MDIWHVIQTYDLAFVIIFNKLDKSKYKNIFKKYKDNKKDILVALIYFNIYLIIKN